jgi:hypothetical protein
VEDLGSDPHYVNSWGCGVAHWLRKCLRYYDSELLVATTTTTGDEDHESDMAQSVDQELINCRDWLFTELQIPYKIVNHHSQMPLHKAAYAGNLPVLQSLAATSCYNCQSSFF